MNKIEVLTKTTAYQKKQLKIHTEERSTSIHCIARLHAHLGTRVLLACWA